MDEKHKTTEIERKFLVQPGFLPPGFPEAGQRMIQGYVPTSNETAVRVRLAGDAAWLTLKTPRVGLSRREFEYPIPVDEATDILELLCMHTVEKIRTNIEYEGHTWEIDVFSGKNEGLVLAEIELPTEDTSFDAPDWLGAEVSFDPKYTNSALSREPFLSW